MKLTQEQKVLKYLKKHKSINQVVAGIKLGVWRLSERVRRLEASKCVFNREPDKKSHKLTRYTLVSYPADYR